MERNTSKKWPTVGITKVFRSSGTISIPIVKQSNNNEYFDVAHLLKDNGHIVDKSFRSCGSISIPILKKTNKELKLSDKMPFQDKNKCDQSLEQIPVSVPNEQPNEQIPVPNKKYPFPVPDEKFPVPASGTPSRQTDSRIAVT